MQNFSIQDAKTFLSDFTATISKASAGDIVWAQSMLFETGTPEKYIESIVDALCMAKENGAEVYVLIDSFGLLTSKEIPVKNRLYTKKISSDIKKMEEEKHLLRVKLEKANINFRISGSLNRFKAIWPWAFCNHRKAYGLISPKAKKNATWISSINLSDTAFNHFEIALRTNLSQIVDITYRQFLADFERVSQWRNKTFVINNIKYMIENNGNNSNIRKQAYMIIKNAQKFIRFSTQFPPDPFLLRRFIKKARQGVDVQILTSDKSDEFNFRKPFNYFDKNFNRILLRNRNITRGYFPGKVHAKILYSEKEALIGSDNITVMGKILQTKEDMLYISNSEFIHDLDKFFQKGWIKAEKYP